MPKREERLNPMSRRRGRPPGPPPGQEWMVLGVTITCPCAWQGFATSEAEAISLWEQHIHKSGHEPGDPAYVIDGA